MRRSDHSHSFNLSNAVKSLNILSIINNSFIEENSDYHERLIRIFDEICDFYNRCITFASLSHCTLIILSVFPRYFKGNKETGYFLPHESLFRKINKKLRQFIDTLVLKEYRRTGKWVRVRFLDLSSFFLENVSTLLKDPNNDPHLSTSGKHLLVEKIKNIIYQEYRKNFIPVGKRAEKLIVRLRSLTSQQTISNSTIFDHSKDHENWLEEVD